MAKKVNPLRFVNEASEELAEIIIEGTIGYEDWWGDHEYDENTNRQMADEINRIKNLKAKTILVKIHSLGGSVDHALAIYDQLKDLKSNIITQINGCCASAATLIFCAGSDRKISKNALFLIHKCLSGIRGNENALQAELEAQRTFNERAIEIYKEAGVADEEKLKALMNENNGNGKWIAAKDVKEFGFATEIYNETTKAASFSHEMFNQSGLPAIPQGYDNLIESERKETRFDWLDPLKEKITDFFSSNKEKDNIINNQTNTEMKKFFALFPIIFALMALKEDADYDPSKGANFNDEQMKALEGQLNAYNELKIEAEQLKKDKATAETDLAEAVKKRDELQAKVNAIPTPVAQVTGSDSEDNKDDFKKYMDESPYYNNVKENL